ncbi:MAG: ATP-binding protein [Endomicrobium sp.]|jgi:predicted AAA+ superfamily ATPase|nr:ATP-binding protein [Endomicrobium sp.]
MIQRNEYLNKLIAFKDKNLIKVIMGIRRCGKSTLLKIYIDYLKSLNISPEEIIFINFEDMDNSDLTDPKLLHNYIIKKLSNNKMTYIFLDEVQLVKDFEKVVNSLNLRQNIDLYITGSNAYFLSGEMTTLLSGRYVAIEMMPLSFREYYSAVSDGSTDYFKYYQDYLKYSSFPFAIKLNKDVEKVNFYLSAIVDSIILKDVVKRKKITEVSALERLLNFIFANIGSITSTKKIADYMKSAGYKIAVQTIESYLSALSDSYIIYKTNRLDVNGKEYLKANDKYYVADIGLRYYLLGDKRKDYSVILENIVYLELLRRGYKVYIGRVGNLEIDFIAFKNGVPIYYQTALTIKEELTFKREFTPLTKVKDNYEKYIITLDAGSPSNDNGIKTINLFDFLLF